MNERIKAVRLSQSPKMSQDAFGARIGITGAAVSRIESGERNITEQIILSVCREFGVSETWLRTGEGEMLEKTDEDTELAKILGQISGSNDILIKAIIKSYWLLDDKDRAAVRKMVDRLVEEMSKKNTPGE